MILATTLETSERTQLKYWSCKFLQKDGDTTQCLMEIQSEEFNLKNKSLFVSMYENTYVRAMKTMMEDEKFRTLILYP